jgi:pyruvate formate lyase activating enzyme
MDDTDLSRREFLLNLSKLGFAVACGNCFSFLKAADFQWDDNFYKYAPPAKYWISAEAKGAKCIDCHSPKDIKFENSHYHKDKVVKCLLCAQGCIIKENKSGKCRARRNVNGELRSLVYGRPISTHVDPIEKKPFYHFMPGSNAYSIATAGCPLSCQFCQNWEISQARPEDYRVKYVPANEIADNANAGGIPIIAFTYNEPTVFIEYMLDIARLAKAKKIKSALVSCGFMNPEPLRDICDTLDAIKIDLKGFSEDFYKKVCHAELKPVLRTIKQIAKSKTHLEIVNLVVPTLNDSERMMHNIADWIINEVGPDVPLHFTRFHPDFKLANLPPTPIASLEKAREIAMSKGLRYVYIGNVPGHSANSTFCPQCKKVIIKRTNFFMSEMHMKKGRCAFCNYPIAGVWH